MDKLQMILDFITNNMMASAGVVAIVLEFALRLAKTSKPQSILLLAKSALIIVAGICGKLAEFLDKVIPQNVA